MKQNYDNKINPYTWSKFMVNLGWATGTISLLAYIIKVMTDLP